MKIKETLLKIVAAAGAILAAIYYVLFQKAKEDRKTYELEEIKEEVEAAQTIAAAETKAEEKVNKEKEKNETLVQAAAKPNISGLNAMYDLMRE